MHAISTPRFVRASTLVVALVTCGAASAASVQYDFSKADTPTTWTDTRVLSKFNPALGTLQSVDFFLGGTMVTQAELNNKNPNAGQTITNNTVGNYYIMNSDSGATYFQSSSSTYSLTATLNAGDGSSAYVAPHGLVGPKNTLAFASTTQSYNDLATLAGFTGTGTISLDFLALAVSSGTTGPNSNIANLTSATGNGFVRYNYVQAAPEPASFGALAVGALALLRRRKAVVR